MKVFPANAVGGGEARDWRRQQIPEDWRTAPAPEVYRWHSDNVDLVKIPTSSFHNFKYPSWVFHQWLKCAFLLGHSVVTSKSVFFLSIRFGRMQIILNFLRLPSSLFPFCSTANERQAVVIPTAQWRLVITSYARERHTVSNATATLKLTSAIDKVISVAVGVWPDESGEFT